VSGTGSQQALLTRMREVVTSRAEHVAVREHGRTFTYAELGTMIDCLYRALGEAGRDAGEPIGLLLDRSALAYAAMWASIGHGSAYVPLNTSYPQTRLRNIIGQAGIGTVVCDQDTRDLAQALGIDTAHLVIAAPTECPGDAPAVEQPWWQARTERDVAYVLFTSGSTGQPKGVPISYDNLLAFIDNMNGVIEYLPNDVCSQVCELSFDFSVHEIYLALLNGCTLCPARQIDLFNPAHYIASRSITVWIAVPSLARVILGNDIPIGDSLHGIRISIFNGEALTAGLAAAWRDAAPNAQIWNSYGPTECTVAVTAQRWSGDPELVEAEVIGIGAPFPDCQAALLDDANIVPTSSAPDGSTGELLLATPQRFSGYTDTSLESPFVTDSRGTTYYRTGDHVRWRGGRLYHLGRLDYQVKIGGHRIELMEIEHRLRRFLDIESLAVITHPAQHPTELVLFIEGASAPPTLHAETLGLPAYMLPKRTIVLEALPTNPHGKLDRPALQSLAEAKL
jgi:amino acid adenylation domain-containing protein